MTKLEIQDGPSARIFRISLRLGGYSIWSAVVHPTLYISRFSPEGVKTTRAGASCSLGATQEVLERHSLHVVHELLDVGFRSTRRLATTWLRRSRGFVRTEAMGYLTCRGPVRDMGYPMPTQVVENKCRTDLGL